MLPVSGLINYACEAQLETCDAIFSTTRAATVLIPVVSGRPVTGLCQGPLETFPKRQVTFQKRKYCKFACFEVGIPYLGVAVIDITKYGKSCLKRQLLPGGAYDQEKQGSSIPVQKYAFLSEIWAFYCLRYHIATHWPTLHAIAEIVLSFPAQLEQLGCWFKLCQMHM